MTSSHQNPYDILGVPRDASDADIKSAFRQQAMRFHPDRNPGDKVAEEKFKACSEAYAALKDPEMRARVDRYGSHVRPGSSPSQDFTHVNWQDLFQDANVSVNWSARGDIPKTGNVVFDALFGMATDAMRKQGLLPGEDIETHLLISLREARDGAEKTLYLPKRKRDVRVTIPAGVHEGQRLRLKGLGGVGQPPGDVYVALELDMANNTRVEGKDILADVWITPLEAEDGGDVVVSGFKLRVPPNTQEGATLRYPGKGLAGGDIILHIHIAVWKGLWRRAKTKLGLS